MANEETDQLVNHFSSVVRQYTKPGPILQGFFTILEQKLKSFILALE
jgi:hypothetical protein